jgi:hypothetical protein
MRQTFGGRNALGVVQFHALRFRELEQAFTVSAHVALHFGQCWEFLAFGLADVEHIYGAEANELRLCFAVVGCILRVNFGRDFVLARETISP